MSRSSVEPSKPSVALVWHRSPFSQDLERRFGWELIDSWAKYEATDWRAYRQVLVLAELRWEEGDWLEMRGLQLAVRLGMRFPQLRERLLIATRFSEAYLHKHHEQRYFKAMAAAVALVDLPHFCRRLSRQGFDLQPARQLRAAYLALWALLVNFDSYDEGLVSLTKKTLADFNRLRPASHLPQVKTALRSFLEKLFPRLYQIHAATRMVVEGPPPLEAKEREVYQLCLSWYDQYPQLSQLIEPATLLWEEYHFSHLHPTATRHLIGRCREALLASQVLLWRLESGGKRIRVLDQLRS
ncbi:MAG: hypothetical protein AAFW73_19030 [Bacteroidota bacterium]